MPASQLEISGRVGRRRVDIGSKSERDAVVLNLNGGGHYILRRANGPSFGDTGLDSLIGSSIKVQGTAIGRTLIMQDWQTLSDPSKQAAIL